MLFFKELKYGPNFTAEKYHFVVNTPVLTEQSVTIKVGPKDYHYLETKKYGKVMVAETITKITKIKFSDSIKLYITVTDFCFASRKKQFWRGDSITYTYRISDKGIPYLSRKGMFPAYIGIDNFKNIFQKCTELFNRIGLNNYLENIPIYDSVQEYFFMRNPKLNQLPAAKKVLIACYYNFEITPEKTKRRILYYLNKGDTKKATEIFLHGEFPKSIRRYFLNTHNNWDFIISESRDFYLNNISTDNIVNTLNTTKHALQVMQIYLTFNKRYNLNTIANFFKDNSYNDKAHQFVDSFNMFNSLRREFNITLYPESKESILDYHDRLSREYNHAVDLKNEAYYKPMKEPWESSLKTLEQDKYIVRPLPCIYEMREIGRKLHICVGSYMPRQYEAYLEIAVVTDLENNYIACLEVVDNHLVQAKLRYNSPVRSNIKIKNIVENWTNLNNIIVATKNMDVENDVPRPLIMNPPPHNRPPLFEREAHYLGALPF